MTTATTRLATITSRPIRRARRSKTSAEMEKPPTAPSQPPRENESHRASSSTKAAASAMRLLRWTGSRVAAKRENGIDADRKAARVFGSRKKAASRYSSPNLPCKGERPNRSGVNKAWLSATRAPASTTPIRTPIAMTTCRVPNPTVRATKKIGTASRVKAMPATAWTTGT
jgi:hypothetical protein